MTTTMNMLPNDHHPGPRCACAECQRRYPEVSAPAQPTSNEQLAFALERVAIYRTHKTILLPYAGSMIALADEIERLQTQNSNLLDALNAKQAKIDALMLEFCPGEMSAEQRANWANSQQRAAPEPSDAREPTPEMIRQGIWAWQRNERASTADDVRAIYVAMRRMEERSSQPPCGGMTGWRKARCTKPTGHDGPCEFSPGTAQPPGMLQRYAIRGRLMPLSENGIPQLDVVGEASHEVYLCVDVDRAPQPPLSQPVSMDREPLDIIMRYKAERTNEAQAAAEIVRYARAVQPPELELYRCALQHIAYEPLTDDPEASAVKCLEEATRIARETLAGTTKSGVQS